MSRVLGADPLALGLVRLAGHAAAAAPAPCILTCGGYTSCCLLLHHICWLLFIHICCHVATCLFGLLRRQGEQVPTCSLNHCINNSHNRGLAHPCSWLNQLRRTRSKYVMSLHVSSTFIVVWRLDMSLLYAPQSLQGAAAGCGAFNWL